MQRITADKRVLTRRFSRSMATYESAAVVQRGMAAHLIDELRLVSGADRFDNVLELGCGTGMLTWLLLENCRLSRLILNDLVPECERTARRARLMKPAVIARFLDAAVAIEREGDNIYRVHVTAKSKEVRT